MGNFYKILPESPHRQEAIKRAMSNNMFLFDTKLIYKGENCAYVYGISNKKIDLPFEGKIISDYDGRIEYKEINNCCDLYGNQLSSIYPNTLVILCIEDLSEIALKYGFLLMDIKEIKFWL